MEWIKERLLDPIPTWYAFAVVGFVVVVTVLDILKRRLRRRKPKRNPELVYIRDAYIGALNRLYDKGRLPWSSREREFRRLKSAGFDIERHILPHPDKIKAQVIGLKDKLRRKRQEPAATQSQVITHS